LFGTVEHLGVAASDYQIALDLEALGGAAGLPEAVRLLDEAIATLRKKDAAHPRVGEYLLALGRLALALGDRKEARASLTEARDRLRRDRGPSDVLTREAEGLLRSL
jgi:tetratricopeptide (TPR) repeat protein